MHPQGFKGATTDSPIGIVGSGRVAQALGRLLHERGQPVVAIAGRDFSRTSQAAAFIGKGVQPLALSDLSGTSRRVLIAVPDDALPGVAEILASANQPPALALHTCGSRGPEALQDLEACGTSCSTFHPLQTVSTPDQGVADLPGSFFGITGSGSSIDWALEICDLLKGHALNIPSDRHLLYHAAAVMASNYIVATIDAAVILMGEAGVDRDSALAALGPLIRASVQNSLAQDPVQALTGPIERGDEQTVASHLNALRDAAETVPESVRELYRWAGLHAADVARRKSPATDRRKIESLLRE